MLHLLNTNLQFSQLFFHMISNF